MAPDFKKLRGALRLSVCAFIIALVAVCSVPPVTAIAAETKTAETPKPAAPPPPVTIPLADIATRATEVSNLLGNLTASAAPSAQIENIAKTLPELSEKLNAQFAATTKSLEAEPTLDTLQTLQQDWERRQVETTGWLTALTTQATRLQQAMNQLGDLQKTWGSTRADAQAAKAPDPILGQIDATLAAITAAQAKLQSERAALLDLQSRVAQEVTKCATALAQIGESQHKAVEGILVPDAPPIWRAESWVEALDALPEHVRKSAAPIGRISSRTFASRATEPFSMPCSSLS